MAFLSVASFRVDVPFVVAVVDAGCLDDGIACSAALPLLWLAAVGGAVEDSVPLISSTTRRIPRAISVKASSCGRHLITGRPSRGRTCSLPKGAVSQSQERIITGITRASFRS